MLYSKIAYLGLGANLGERERMLKEALRLLEESGAVRILDVSPVYETDPVGFTDQPAFLNLVSRIETSLSPEELLRAAMEVERGLGRVRTVRWGPRTIDIDILMYDNMVLHTEALTLPHPRLMERAFVLIPLLDVMPAHESNWQPGFAQIEAADNGVRRWSNIKWPVESGHFES